MKRTLYILTLILLFYSQSFAQDFTEYYFSFEIKEKSEIDTITRLISIDNVKGLEVFAYANQKELNTFQKLGYKIEFLKKDIPKSLTMATTVAEMSNWDRYPTYEVYRQMMKDFESNYPSICKLDSIGTTRNGRQLYVLKISDNVSIEENEPEYFYTSTMHGDETTGFILMLRLADSILTNYSSEPEIANLVNEIEIFINPNANPDGTYNGGNNTVSGAIRYNGITDLNRDFPDPYDGANSPYQLETQAMMDFAEEHSFVMAANFHGGAAVMNYPWDTWYLSQNPHADTDWFEQVCTDYVTTARTVYSNYMTSITPDGVTHGATWYRIGGGRQDYMNYWHQCREITIELSNVKLLATESLNNYWNYNKQSLLDFIEESLYGIRGTVKDNYGNHLNAMVWVIDHDDSGDSSMVFTDPDIGDYHRLIEPGTYDIIASAYGCISDTIENVNVVLDDCQTVNFILNSDPSLHSLSGLILDSINNSPLENVKIKLANTTLYPKYTNINGEYNFEYAIENTIHVLIEKNGYNPVDTNVLFFNSDTIHNLKMNPTKSLSGIILDEIDNSPLENVKIILANTSHSPIFSNKDGEYYFDNVLDGTINVLIEKTGYHPIDTNIQFFNNDTIHNFKLNPTKSLSGTILDEIDNSPLENVKIILANTSHNPVFSNKDGEYYFDNVLDGTINVLIQKEGFIPIDTNILFFSPDTIYNFKLYPAKTEDFEEENFNKFNWKFTGNANWIISNTSYEGDYSAVSGNIGDNQSSSMEFTETIYRNGYISFYKKVSSEVSYDYLKFYINGVEKGKWSGQSDWSIAQYEITEGVHTFKWEYIKDFGIYSGSDCAWVDLISLPANDTSLYITPKYIYDTLNTNEISEHQFIIMNNGNVSNEYSLDIDQSWIDLDVTNDLLDYNETDTITLSINSTSLTTGYYSSDIIVNSLNQGIDTISVNLMIRDTISPEISTNQIIDTLWGGETNNYDIIINNNSSASMTYSIEIENSDENNWINLNKTSGNLLLTETDTIQATVSTIDFGFGELNCNIIFQEQGEDHDTISVNLFVLDTLATFITPDFINDTLFIGDSSEHMFVIKNIGNKDLIYSLFLEFPVESQTWIELEKENGTIIQESTDTIQVFLNTIYIEAGYYSSNIIVTSQNQEIDTVPVNLMIIDTISSSISPDQVIDTLWAGDSFNYDIVITNNGTVSLDYSVEIENSAENSWISLDQNSGSLLLTESDTIKVSINTTDIGFGEFNCNVIFQEQDEDTNTIPVFIYVKDTILSEINPTMITDTLNQNSTKDYPIIIKNIGNSILDYTLTIDYPTKSDIWISLDEESGSVGLANADTIVATINSNDLLAGDYVCSVKIIESDGDEFTIPVDINVKDTMISEINPTSITDTLDSNNTKDYPIIIKNIGNCTLDYTVIIDYPTKSGSWWISLNKESGSVDFENTDTIIATINSNDLSADDYVCLILIHENDGDIFTIAVDIHVNQVQSVKLPEIIEFRLFPNPFNNYFEIEFYTIDNKNVNISLYDICGKKIYEDNFETVSNTINKYKILESDFKSGKVQKGIYFIQLLFDKEKLTKRVLKN